MTKAEDQIIFAAIRCIEKYGLSKTTIRKIGKEAGMNSASISYYFRSKDILMQKVMEITLQNAFDISDLGLSDDMSPKERLNVIVNAMFDGAIQYPNITKAHLSGMFLNNDYDSPAIKRANELILYLEKELIPLFGEERRNELRINLIQLASSTYLMGCMFPGFFTAFPEIDFNDAATRRNYVAALIDKLFNKEGVNDEK
jgi:AcrR family transcriptional regulator